MKYATHKILELKCIITNVSNQNFHSLVMKENSEHKRQAMMSLKGIQFCYGLGNKHFFLCQTNTPIAINSMNI